MATAGFIMGLIGIILQILPVIFVTGSLIAFNIMKNGEKNQVEIIDPNSPYIGKQLEYSWYTGIGSLTTRIKDHNYSVTVDMILGYDLYNTVATSEMESKQYELRDFVKIYFSEKNTSELQPENEERLKQEIRDILNTRFLETARIRIILFNKLDVFEVY
jgi:flagellar FliL protein